jgi:hypothetical protein
LASLFIIKHRNLLVFIILGYHSDRPERVFSVRLLRLTVFIDKQGTFLKVDSVELFMERIFVVDLDVLNLFKQLTLYTEVVEINLGRFIGQSWQVLRCIYSVIRQLSSVVEG